MINKKAFPALSEEHFREISRIILEPVRHKDFPGVNYRLYQAALAAREFARRQPMFNPAEFRRAVDEGVRHNRALWSFLIRRSGVIQYKPKPTLNT